MDQQYLQSLSDYQRGHDDGRASGQEEANASIAALEAEVNELKWALRAAREDVENGRIRASADTRKHKWYTGFLARIDRLLNKEAAK